MKAITKFGATPQTGEDIRPDILLLHAKNKCLDCRHPLFLHFENRCGMCTCVRKPIPRVWSNRRKQKLFQAVADAAKFYPNGIELTNLIYVASRHNRELFAYFQIAKFGRRVTHIVTKTPYDWFVNARYLTFRKHLIAGRVPDLKIITMVPQFTVAYAGDGLI